MKYRVIHRFRDLQDNDRIYEVGDEYEGKRYIRIEVSEAGILPSGNEVKAGQAVWVEVSKVEFLIPEFE